MVFKTLHLARQSIAKTFAHGYAQPLVAASQSSYASQNSPFNTLGTNASGRFGKIGPTHTQQSLPSATTQSVHVNKLVSLGLDNVDSNLATYHTAWQKHQRADEKEWKQIPSTRRVCWNQSSKSDEPILIDEQSAEAQEEKLPSQEVPNWVKSSVAPGTSANIYFAGNVSEESPTSKYAKNSDLAQSVAQQREESASSGENGSLNVESSLDLTSYSSERSSGIIENGSSITGTNASEISSFEAQTEGVGKEKATNASSDFTKPTHEINARFDASSYNSLLAAAISLPRARHYVVPKALAIYADMLRRRVVPDTNTYSILIELLSTRVLDVIASKRVLEEKRVRFGGLEETGRFMFRSNETDFDILAEDDSLSNAVKIFNAATSRNDRSFSLDTYKALILSCAESDRIDEMVRVYSHMETQKIVPSAYIFVEMIQAFARAGDLRSSVECYNEYKAFAIANDNGESSLQRDDHAVYIALVKAYNICRRSSQGAYFLNKIEQMLKNSQDLYRLQEQVSLEASIPEMLRIGHFEAALDVALGLATSSRDLALTSICITSADKNVVDMANKSFNLLSKNSDMAGPAMAMGAMYIRNANLNAAEPYWKLLEVSGTKPQLVEFTAMHTLAMIEDGQAKYGLSQGRQMFARIREALSDLPEYNMDIVEQIDEAIEVISNYVFKHKVFLDPLESMDLLRSMVENGGLITPVAGQLLAGFGPDSIAQLDGNDIKLLIQIQAGMVLKAVKLDVANEARFAHLLEVAMLSKMSVDKETSDLIDDVFKRSQLPLLSKRWRDHSLNRALYPDNNHDPNYLYRLDQPSVSQYEDSFDPYAPTTDNKGSVAIIDMLEKSRGKSSAHLQDGLARFHNMRRTGRHPRFYTYAKLILAAAKENRLETAQEILALAKQDVPYLPQYRLVRHGWITILDAMVAACLTIGQRYLAAKYHKDLLDMGATPSANTFGLYITTLKESAKTFDEATEAVKIFLRAKAEGVEPSSFLYNALIGKLGKARRIDDCLFYFSEMRNQGIRPTSVTYGTIVNALCRVSDEKFAEELFEEMESMPNYKPRPAPYHSLMQYFLTTKRDRTKVLTYYERMRANNIAPTMHTYKLLIDAHATLEPSNMAAAEAVLDQIRQTGQSPEAVHFASLIHAKGCIQHDVAAARSLFDSVVAKKLVRPQPCLYQALFEVMVANRRVSETDTLVRDMRARSVEMTAYIANSLIHGWALAGNIARARQIFASVQVEKREPSTYDAMTRALIAAERRDDAMNVVNEMLGRGYPAAVSGKVAELVTGGRQ